MAADDEDAVRAAYRSVLAGDPSFELVGEAADGQAAVDAFERLRPDLVLMDLQMPVMNGIDAIRAITDRWRDARIVAMTTFATREHIVAALRSGASGYLVKGVTGPQLLAALRQAMAGEMPFSTIVRRQLAQTIEPRPGSTRLTFTAEETTLLEGVAHGWSDQEVADRLGTSPEDVAAGICRLAQKMEVPSRAQMLVHALRWGVVDPGSLA